jgi:hypothetical protein
MNGTLAHFHSVYFIIFCEKITYLAANAFFLVSNDMTIVAIVEEK